MSGEGFLDRWSRRKRIAGPEAGQGPAPEDAAAVPEQAVAAPEAGVPAPAAASEPEITPEELAALPRVEDLLPGADFKPFLRRGVPAALRRAALRRMWRLNPAIRDYVDDAREYAYDWNAPGGVPGGGPLTQAQVASALERLFRPPDPVRPPATTVPGAPDPVIEAPADGAVAVPLEAEAPTAASEEPEAPTRRLRHGGATPV